MCLQHEGSMIGIQNYCIFSDLELLGVGLGGWRMSVCRGAPHTCAHACTHACACV